MAQAELKFGLDAETSSRLDDLVMQLRAIVQRIPPAWHRQVDEALDANKPHSVMGWDNRKAWPENIREAVGQAIGRASVCWDNPGGAGVFQSRDAEEVTNELIDWLYSEWLPGEVRVQLEKRDRAVNEMSVNAVSVEDVPRHFDVTVKPVRVEVTVGDRKVGTFAGSVRTGRWEIVSTPFSRRPTVGSNIYPSLVEAIHAAMQAGSWENIGNVPIWITWGMPLDGTRPEEEVVSEGQDDEDDLEV